MITSWLTGLVWCNLAVALALRASASVLAALFAFFPEIPLYDVFAEVLQNGHLIDG